VKKVKRRAAPTDVSSLDRQQSTNELHDEEEQENSATNQQAERH